MDGYEYSEVEDDMQFECQDAGYSGMQDACRYNVEDFEDVEDDQPLYVQAPVESFEPGVCDVEAEQVGEFEHAEEEQELDVQEFQAEEFSEQVEEYHEEEQVLQMVEADIEQAQQEVEAEQALSDQDELEALPQLPTIKQSLRRRSSAYTDEFGQTTTLPQKIVRHWDQLVRRESQPIPEDGELQITAPEYKPQVEFVEDFDEDDFSDERFGRRGNFVVPNFALPRRISLSDMADLLNECIEETAIRRESMGGKIMVPDPKGGSRKASIVVRRPSCDIVSMNAVALCGAIDEIVEKVESTESADNKLSADTVAEILAEKLPEVDILDMDEDIVPDEDIEELTVEDVKDTWEGMVDTTECPQSAVIPDENTVAKQICDAISELSTNLACMEQNFVEKLDALAEERPALCNTASEIRDDVADFIAKLSEKLKEKDQILADDAAQEIKDRDLNAKAEFLRAEQERLDQLREEQERMKMEKEAELRAEQEEADRIAAAEQAEIDAEQALIDAEQARIDALEQERIRQEAENAEIRAARRKAERGGESSDEEEDDGKKKKKKKKGKGDKDKKNKKNDRLLKRRKTSTGRKLDKLRAETLCLTGPEHTPAPDRMISTDDFLSAAGAGRPKAVLKYIQDGNDINKQDEYKRTALQKAALYGEIEIIDILVQHKAKLNLSDKLGDTALHWAARGGHPEAISKIVQGGAKVNTKDKLFSTPLHVAVRCGSQECVEQLLSLGADINAKDREGDTPMHDAVRLGKFKLIKTLLSSGSNLRAKNMNGHTPIDMVQTWYQETKSHHADIILKALVEQQAITGK